MDTPSHVAHYNIQNDHIVFNTDPIGGIKFMHFVRSQEPVKKTKEDISDQIWSALKN